MEFLSEYGSVIKLSVKVRIPVSVKDYMRWNMDRWANERDRYGLIDGKGMRKVEAN